MKKIQILILFLISSFYWGCFCEPCKHSGSIIGFYFKIGTNPTDFTFAETDTIILYKLAKSTTVIIDSSIITHYPFFLDESGQEFGHEESQFWTNDYLVITQSQYKFMLTDFEISYKDKGSGPCMCKINTAKKLKVNGVTVDLTGATVGNNYVLFTK